MDNKLLEILELQEQGKTRTEIWKALGYSKCSGLTRYMQGKGYIYNEQQNKYELVQEQEEKQEENGFQELINEINFLKKEVQKLKDEIEELKVIKRNERGAGRKERLSIDDKEQAKEYRKQGKTIKEIADIYSCSVGLIHKIINESH